MYKRNRTYWVVNGKRTIKGKVVKASDPGAIEKTKFIGYFTKNNGKEVFLGDNLETARLVENRLKSQKLEAKRGVPSYVIHHEKSLDELFDEYMNGSRLGTRREKIKSEKHIKRTRLVFKTVVNANGWLVLKDLSSKGVVAVINNKLDQDDPKDKAKRFGKKSANHWIGYWISFGNWLERNNYVLKNPFSEIQKFSESDIESDRRLVRRSFSNQELLTLFEKTHELTVRLRLTGEDRAMLYKLAAVTGFRSGELASLTPELFFLDHDVPFVKLKGINAKNGKTIEQVILTGFVGELKSYLAKKPLGKPIWDISKPTHKTKLVRVLRRDFEEIKKKYPDQTAGLFDTNPLAQIDFHALRTTYSTMLAEKVQSSALKDLARHSDIRTTHKYYIRHGHMFLHSQLEAALGDKICPTFVTPGSRNPKESNELKIDRAISLIRRFVATLSLSDAMVFARKLGFFDQAITQAG